MFKIDFLKNLPVFLLLGLIIFGVSSCRMTPEKILAKYSAATGEDKISAPKSLSFKASINQMPTDPAAYFSAASANPQPRVSVSAMSFYCSFPNKVYMDANAGIIVHDQFGDHLVREVKVIHAFDGQDGWETISDPKGGKTPRKLLPSEIDEMKNLANNTFLFNPLSKISKPKYLGEQTIKINIMQGGTGMMVDKQTYAVEAYVDGKKQTMYFDTDEGLLWKVDEINALTNDKTSSVMSDYKQFGNIKVPATINMQKFAANGKATENLIMSISDFSFDAPEPAGAFVKPAL